MSSTDSQDRSATVRTAEALGTPDPAAPRWDLIVLCAALAGMTILDLSKVTVALPGIADNLGAGPVGLQLVMAGYIVSYAVVLVPAGRLGDSNLRKHIMVAAIAAYLLSSAAGALAPNVAALVVARIVQGASAGMLMPQVLGTMHAHLHGPDRGRGFGLYGATVNASIAAGPLLGGALMVLVGTDSSWRTVFWMNIPIGIAALFAVLRYAPTGSGAPVTRSIDGLGLVLFSAGLVCALLPFLTTTGRDADSPARWLLLAPAAALVTLFALRERQVVGRGGIPLLDRGLTRLRSYRTGVAIGACWFAANLGIVFVVMLYLQQGLGLSPLTAGLVNVTYALAAGVASWFGGRVIQSRGRIVVVTGICIALIGLTSSIVVGFAAPEPLVPVLLAVTQALAGAGAGFVVSPNQALSLDAVPKSSASSASAVTQLGQRVGNSVGTAACAAAFFAIAAQQHSTFDDGDALRSAFGGGLLVAAAFMAAALALSLVDLRSRRAETAPTTVTPDSPLRKDIP